MSNAMAINIMIWLSTEQLATQLQETLRSCYVLFGNDPLLLQESLDRIRDQAKTQQFNEYLSVTLSTTTNWDIIFSLCQARGLFASRQAMLLTLPDNGINVDIGKKMIQLASLLHSDLLLILCSHKLTYATVNSTWFKELSKNAVLVNCTAPNQTQLPNWVTRRAEGMKLILDDSACQLLCHCYEGNLLALTQALERLSLLYPDGNLTLLRVKTAVNNATHFTPFHWVDAMLSGQIKRAAHILLTLKLEATEPVILLRSIQHEVLLLLMLKRQINTITIHTLFDHYKVRQHRQGLLIQAMNRLTSTQLRNAVTLMTKIELTLKQNHGCQIWSDLSALALLLCGKSLPAAILYV